MDSSFDSEEFDAELRDHVEGAKVENDVVSEDEDNEIAQNTDLTYYDKMNADEKILTLKNRAFVLAQKQEQMME